MKTIAMLAAAATLLLRVEASAQPGPDHHPGGMTPPGPTGATPNGRAGSDARGGMTGADVGRMLDMMRERMMADATNRAFQHMDGKLAYMRAELHITDAQLPQWDTFTEAVRSAMAKLQQAYPPPMQLRARSMPMPDQFEHQVSLLTAQVDAIRSMEAPANALYASLSDEQKRTANELIADHMTVHLIMP